MTLSLNDVQTLTPYQLEPWMIYAPWRTTKEYAQRRIHQRVDNASKDFRGWRVSVESSAEGWKSPDVDRQRFQKSFYFATHGGFCQATSDAQHYRNSCETELGLVPWRPKKLAHIEDAFTVSGIVLNVGKRAPFWIYRQNGRRLIGSIAQKGLREAYVWLAQQVAALEGLPSVPDDVPLPLLAHAQKKGLIQYGINFSEIDKEDDRTKTWVKAFVDKHVA